MDKQELARLKELAQKAMSGPWELDETPTDIATYYEIYSADWMVADCEKDGASATFIAAANPQAILELIAYVLAEQERCKRTEENNRELRDKLIRLNKEADWLAEKLIDACPSSTTCNRCPVIKSCPKITDIDWREAARKAVEERENGI